MKRRTSLFLFVFLAATVLFAIWDPNDILTDARRGAGHFFDRITSWSKERINDGAQSPGTSQLPQSSPADYQPSFGKGTIVLASWNIRVFSSSSRDETELGKICDILQRYDIVAIQELRDTKVMDRCVEELKRRGHEYSFVVSKPVGTSTHKELYAYLYKRDSIRHLGNPFTYGDRADRFIREPYIAHFRSGDFDFTMVTTHILYGSGKNDPARAGELAAIADVFREVQAADGSENDVILTGDFNEHPESTRFSSLTSIASIRLIIQGSGVTTVIHDSSLYDNIVFQSQYTGREYSGTWGVYKFDEEMFGNDDQMASKVCSDHRPVWAVFRTDAGDDD